jgi:hypothetical protein
MTQRIVQICPPAPGYALRYKTAAGEIYIRPFAIALVELPDATRVVRPLDEDGAFAENDPEYMGTVFFGDTFMGMA